ncbi:hypothetical protein C8P68_104393 [Mucilaginibacter yixingensis]|uniref:Uncharacterized protein n=1 Tax=Mucilaginibacter yixingensis TaxID=1295612 RepID=A0A2T5JA62_9SPHI|nr:hypothetical protein [Mucilaginibacter yixingensis]PTQ96899.1 hypothetical protein C8P68_104393 [Mucilaginibacter yixingensis]
MQIKKSLLSFIIINIVYLVYFFLLMIWLKQPIIAFRAVPPVQLAANVVMVIQVVMSLLNLLIFAGLVFLLSSFKESFLISAAVAAYALLQIPANLIALLHLYAAVANWITVLNIVNMIALLWMIVGLFFVRNIAIRNYFRWFSICVLLSVLLSAALPYVYVKIGMDHFYINPGIIKLPSFVVSLILFLRIYGDQPKTKRL